MTSAEMVGAGPGTTPGRTTITARALDRLATGIASDAARVPARDVSLTLADERGALRATVTVPVSIRLGDTATLTQRADEVRRAVIDGMHDLTGRKVASVDVRYSGVRRDNERRVR